LSPARQRQAALKERAYAAHMPALETQHSVQRPPAKNSPAIIQEFLQAVGEKSLFFAVRR
jgi:hypothetical protein